MHWDAGSNSVTTKNFSPWIETRNEMRAGKQWKKRIKKRRKQLVEIFLREPSCLKAPSFSRNISLIPSLTH